MTAAIGLMAIFVTIAVKTGRTAIDPFVMSSLAFESEPWRLASSALPHGDWLHLGFNVIWLWILGTRVEEVLGSVTAFAIMLVLAVGSGAAEFAFASGGIGLSGVGYGLVGLLWILARRDARFRDAIDRNVLITFILWGLLCVLFTIFDVMPIGNVAHASGFVLGAVIGFVIAPGPMVRRAGAGIGLVVLVAAFVAAAGWYRPEVNLSANASSGESHAGWKALGDKQYELAARHLRRALALDPADAGDWFNYGVALQYVSDPDGLTPFDVWQRAYALDPADKQIRAALASEYVRRASAMQAVGDRDNAALALKRAIQLDPTMAPLAP